MMSEPLLLPDASLTIDALIEGLSYHVDNHGEVSQFYAAAAHSLLKASYQDADPARRADALILVARIFYVAGHVPLMVAPAAAAVEMANLSGDLVSRRRALTAHGVILSDIGEFAAAFNRFVEALDIAEQLEDPLQCGTVWNNIAATHIYSGQAYYGIASAERAADLSSRSDSPVASLVRLFALGNITLGCLHAGQYDRGVSACHRATGIFQRDQLSPDLAFQLSLIELSHVRLLVEMNDLPAARLQAERCKEYAALAKSPRSQMAADLASGLVDVYSGRVDDGFARIDKVLDQARVMRAFLRDVLLVLIKANEACDRPARSLNYLRELASYNHQARASHIQAVYSARRSQVIPPSADSVSPLSRDRLRADFEVLVRVAVSAELAEDPTGCHAYRVGALAGLLALEIGLDPDVSFLIDMSARVHDIGKAGIAYTSLLTPSKLTPEQTALARTHADIGAHLLEKSGLTELQTAVAVVRHHHEAFDGSGYPGRLAGDDIPLAARVVAVADVFDVLSHPRRNRPAMSVVDSLAEIERLSGSRFDPVVVRALRTIVDRTLADSGDLETVLTHEAVQTPFYNARRRIIASIGNDRVSPLVHG